MPFKRKAMLYKTCNIKLDFLCAIVFMIPWNKTFLCNYMNLEMRLTSDLHSKPSVSSSASQLCNCVFY